MTENLVPRGPTSRVSDTRLFDGNRQSWPTTRGSEVSICFRHHDEVTVQFSYAAATHISSISPPPPCQRSHLPLLERKKRAARYAVIKGRASGGQSGGTNKEVRSGEDLDGTAGA